MDEKEQSISDIMIDCARWVVSNKDTFTARKESYYSEEGLLEFNVPLVSNFTLRFRESDKRIEISKSVFKSSDEFVFFMTLWALKVSKHEMEYNELLQLDRECLIATLNEYAKGYKYEFLNELSRLCQSNTDRFKILRKVLFDYIPKSETEMRQPNKPSKPKDAFFKKNAKKLALFIIWITSIFIAILITLFIGALFHKI